MRVELIVYMRRQVLAYAQLFPERIPETHSIMWFGVTTASARYPQPNMSLSASTNHGLGGAQSLAADSGHKA